MIQRKALVLVAASSLFAVALGACEEKNDKPVTETKTEQKTTAAEDKIEKKIDQIGDKAEKKVEEVKNEAPIATGGGPAVAGSREWAREKMAKIRCEHYTACGDIAMGKKYDTLDSCVTRERADLDKDWALKDCAKIDEPRLDACIAAVKANKCGGIFNTAPSDCAESKICIKP
ncbi:MAG: DUF6184 family natural product biosynthesis lipoprotein [Polyangiales bacterium]